MTNAPASPVHQNVAEIITRGLQEFSEAFQEDEIAYLALTSKPEFVVRDHIAWRLHQDLPAPLTSAREWKPAGKSGSGRTDLAILRTQQESAIAEVLLEVKSCYTFDALKSEPARERFPIKAVRDDIDKSFEYAETDTAALALLIVVHPRAPVDVRFFQTVKFARAINSSLRSRSEREVEEAATEFLNSRLPSVAPILSQGTIASGSAFGIPTDLLFWLIGPRFKDDSEAAPQR